METRAGRGKAPTMASQGERKIFGCRSSTSQAGGRDTQRSLQLSKYECTRAWSTHTHRHTHAGSHTKVHTHTHIYRAKLYMRKQTNKHRNWKERRQVRRAAGHISRWTFVDCHILSSVQCNQLDDLHVSDKPPPSRPPPLTHSDPSCPPGCMQHIE